MATEIKKTAVHYENYGDVALDLPPSWSRARLGNSDFVLMTVGHEDGTADAYLNEEPNAEHQFSWIAPKDETDTYHKQSLGYEFISKDTWTKNPKLWRWNAEGRCEFKGQWLAARPARLYDEAQAEKERAGARDLNKEAAARIAETSANVRITDQDGRELQRKSAR